MFGEKLLMAVIFAGGRPGLQQEEYELA
jgi:hypothetical protein